MFDAVSIMEESIVAEKMTSEEWVEEPDFAKTVILDPDGWDRQNFAHSFYEEKITRAEFERRLVLSTIVHYTPETGTPA